MTTAERAAQSARGRAGWAAGWWAHRKRGTHPAAWTAADELRLRALMPHHTAAEIAALLTAEFSIPRTATAVLIRAKRLGLRPASGTFNATTVGYWFGVDAKTVGQWIRRGWLAAVPANGPGSQWCIRPAALEALIRERPQLVDPTTMPRTRWRAFLEGELARDPLLTIDQAVRALGVRASTLQQHLAKGWLPGVRRPERTGAQRGRWLIRRSRLGQFAYRRPELVGVSGRKPRALASERTERRLGPRNGVPRPVGRPEPRSRPEGQSA